MSKFHGRNVRVYIDGFDISGYTNSLSVEQTADIVDVAGFGDSNKNYVVGLYDSKVMHDGFFEDTPTTGGHAVIAPRLGSAVQFMACIGTQQGAFGFAGSAELERTYDVNSSITDAVKHKVELDNYGTQGVDNVTMLLSRAQQSGTGPSFNSGTFSNAGGRFYMQNFGTFGVATPITASGSMRVIGGTDAAMSTAGTVLLADFGAIGSAGGSAQGISYSGTMPQFIQVDCYSGTPNVAVAFVRI